LENEQKRRIQLETKHKYADGLKRQMSESKEFIKKTKDQMSEEEKKLNSPLFANYQKAKSILENHEYSLQPSNKYFMFM